MSAWLSPSRARWTCSQCTRRESSLQRVPLALCHVSSVSLSCVRQIESSPSLDITNPMGTGRASSTICTVRPHEVASVVEVRHVQWHHDTDGVARRLRRGGLDLAHLSRGRARLAEAASARVSALSWYFRGGYSCGNGFLYLRSLSTPAHCMGGKRRQVGRPLEVPPQPHHHTTTRPHAGGPVAKICAPARRAARRREEPMHPS